MMDTVWMRLSVVEDANGNDANHTEYFMFGINAVSRFAPHPKGTALLICQTGSPIAVVSEDEETIFKLIAKIRGTHANQKQNKKTRSKAKASKTKATR